MRPRVCVLRTDGTNCDEETKFALELAGAQGCLVHVNQLRNGEKKLEDYQFLVIPGGFSYGDDVHSGKILAVELTSFLGDQLREFVESQKPVLGICNGFQVLVRTGLLPDNKMGSVDVTLMGNDNGHFECRWIKMRVEKSNCIFTRGLEEMTIEMQVAHGEGKFFTDKNRLNKVEENNQVVFRYVDRDNNPTMSYPHNPNGSLNSIAGICDRTGRILGLMPHPERFVRKEQHPNWRRTKLKEPHGLFIFKNAVKYAAQL